MSIHEEQLKAMKGDKALILLGQIADITLLNFSIVFSLHTQMRKPNLEKNY